MNESKRLDDLIRLLNEKHSMSVSEIMQSFGISAATARRDITKLSLSGKVKRVRNGIIKREDIKNIWQPLDKNITTSQDEKSHIAQQAAKICSDGDNIIINCGSTAFLLGKALCGRNITIITNYYPLASYLIENNHENVIIMGGLYNKKQNIILSPTNGFSDVYTGKYMFTSGKGLTPAGLYKTDMLTAVSEQQIINNIDKVVVVVDSTKILANIGSGMLFCPASKIDIVITGKSANRAVLNNLEKQGAEIILV